MPCCDTDLISTTFAPPPPVGSNACHRSRWECECPAGVDTWGLLLNDCVDNNLCTGQLSCTDLNCNIEIINGCVLADPVPAALAPWCLPKCCDLPTTTTTTTTTTTLPPYDYCNCPWTSTWDCDSGVWLDPVVGSCYESPNDDSYDWIYDGDCDALMVNADIAPCGV